MFDWYPLCGWILKNLGCQLQPFAYVVAGYIISYAKVEKGGKQSLTNCVLFPYVQYPMCKCPNKTIK